MMVPATLAIVRWLLVSNHRSLPVPQFLGQLSVACCWSFMVEPRFRDQRASDHYGRFIRLGAYSPDHGDTDSLLDVIGSILILLICA